MPPPPVTPAGARWQILLNKTDLVSPEALQEVTARLRAINKMAEIIPTVNAAAPLDKLLG